MSRFGVTVFQFFGFAALIAAAAAPAAAASPQSAAAAARPDFAPSGSVSWIRIGEAEFKPPLRGPGPVAEDPAHPTISNDDYRRTGKQPTFPVADLSNPILQPWVREQLRKRNADVLAGKPGFGPQQSCWPRGVPAFLLYGVQPIYIVQGAKDVLMTWQGDHQVRHIYLDVPHKGNTKPSWFGDSVGHYEGDSLVVDTVGLNAKDLYRRFPHPAHRQTPCRRALPFDRRRADAGSECPC